MSQSPDLDNIELPPEPLLERLYRTFGPLAGALLIDSVDLVTAGPLKPFLGVTLGVPVTWWVTSIYGLSLPNRLLLSLLGGCYCLMPFTELIPVATIIAAVGRFEPRPRTIIIRELPIESAPAASGPLNEPTSATDPPPALPPTPVPHESSP